ncbi:3-hydroxyacyl-CoA dehydrogenase family protein [Streptomyces phyllanthi]|uniref:3-hydroxyacyl-CoA dehydrogenase family protein n=1 Tax=Streptomyces phyllanthi TaxID=1803180 RepID=A0A5N8WBV9_9ACTN|nr:3-hydroxyacyl-CoA dehydrogenase family protein [Streptomyces phyllanthi]MPY44789.1 3-hydroxyacyl-CoA dehydrogenase family protein [Streptomyces phyllanthi]
MSSAAAPPCVVGVIGGGRMGAGIAQSFAAAGSRVVVVERDGTTATAALERIATGLRRAAERGTLSGLSDLDVPDRVVAVSSDLDVPDRVIAVSSVAELPHDADLVVEAVPENAGLKAEVLAAAEDVVPDGCVLASNTSSLSVTELAAALRRPGRFLGMHFFSPVPVSALVELVPAPDTDATALDAAVRWTHALGKQDVVVKDCPGFASSRLGLALGLEAIRMVEEGVAEPEAIDKAMRLGYRHPMGPLRLTDLVGLDVRLAIAEHLHTTLGERFAPPRLLREKVARGELGRKTGQGFYRW